MIARSALVGCFKVATGGEACLLGGHPAGREFFFYLKSSFSQLKGAK
jgi:hypothetical protein